ncbi:MAG: GlcNAc-PI de-N-acetylase [Elusimicrobia bacterium RIFOXYC2_FULL_34_12]|nr:MAG: GlcNAc-PI de-N-acetylase [Elusimicrobia bacterium RIFOXYC2_FULL_34_12]
MKLINKGAEIFVPDKKSIFEAITRTTHLAIAAHPDDLEIMAYDGILKCYKDKKKWFCGIVVTNGSGSPKSGKYKKYSYKKFCNIRKKEQKNAAILGKYGSVIFLDYASYDVKDTKNKNPTKDIQELLELAKADIIYTHNLADKHDTHVAVALRTIRATRKLPINIKPKNVYGCEIWGGLDWLCDDNKVIFDVSKNEVLAMKILSVFKSQTESGKKYDSATIGRRKANSTFLSFNKTDKVDSLIYAMDLTPLIKNKQLNIKEYILKYINKFKDNIMEKIESV